MGRDLENHLSEGLIKEFSKYTYVTPWVGLFWDTGFTHGDLVFSKYTYVTPWVGKKVEK